MPVRLIQLVFLAALPLGALASGCGDEASAPAWLETGDVATLDQASPATDASLVIELWAVPADVARFTLSLDTTPVYSHTFIVADGAFTARTFSHVPSGNDLTLLLEGKPAMGDADENVVIFRAVAAGVTMTAGQVAEYYDLQPVQVAGTVPIKAEFPPGDPDISSVSYVEAVFSGARIETPPTFFMSPPTGDPAVSLSQDGSPDNRPLVPVGSGRTLVVTSYDAANVALHQGTSAAIEVLESGTPLVVVSMSGI